MKYQSVSLQIGLEALSVAAILKKRETVNLFVFSPKINYFENWCVGMFIFENMDVNTNISWSGVDKLKNDRRPCPWRPF